MVLGIRVRAEDMINVRNGISVRTGVWDIILKRASIRSSVRKR